MSLEPTGKFVSNLIAGTLPWLVSTGLVILLGVLLARLTWQLILPSQEPLPEAAPLAQSAPAQGAMAGDPLERLRAARLFGRAEPMREAPEQITASRIALDLRGVLVAGADGQGVAIFRIGGKERTFRVGDDIQSGIRLARVEERRVLIERDGRLESIDLPRAELSLAAGSPEPTRPGPAASNSAAQPAVRAVLENPGNLFDYVQPRPVMKDGNLVGYRLQPRPGRTQMLEALGVRPGDVVTGIEGARLDNPQSLLSLMPRLRSARNLSATVLRDGQEVPISIQLQ
ncbi:MAG: type II secretion system protein GspC [Halothiobacillaceae bacterium]